MKGQLLLLLLFAMVFFCVMVVVLNEDEQNGLATTFFLKPPALAQVVYASSPVLSTNIDLRIKGEAGISAYCKTTGIPDLSKLTEHFTTIEIETTDFLLGSMSVPGYPELYDPHVYVHKDGWVLAYYFHDEPIGKIIDVKAKTIDQTKLGTVITQVLNWANAPSADITFYHFEHPEATHMMFVAETYDAGDNEFFIQLPPAFKYYEHSWALGNSEGGMHFTIDGVDQMTKPDAEDRVSDGNSGYGKIALNDLTLGEMHSITVDEYGVLVLLFWAPEPE